MLCGVDASSPGRHAASVAAHLGDRLRADVTLMRVVRRPAAERIVTAGRELDAVADDLGRALATRPAVRVAAGDAATRLAGAARHRGADLVVVGRTPRGRVAGAVAGRTRRRLARRAPCPVVVAPEDVALPTGEAIVLGCDVERPSGAAAATAARLAVVLDASLVIACVLREAPSRVRPTGWQIYDATRRMAAVAAAAGLHERQVEIVERRGRPAVELARAAEDAGGALVVVGAGRRRPWGAVARSSVPEELVREGGRPVVVAGAPVALPRPAAQTLAA